MAPRALLDYEKLVDGVIRKVFGDHFNLFSFGSESSPDVDELLNVDE